MDTETSQADSIFPSAGLPQPGIIGSVARFFAISAQQI
jgi:hypothetical protein